ncbi:MAG: DUF934 domain-containing protein [Rhodospirillaceae bacterium]
MALLLKDGAVADNPWITIADGAADPLPDGPVIVGLAEWRRDRAALSARNTPLGVRLKSSERADEIAADLDRFTLVALEFPVFRDGRPFSTARELREHYGFRGEIRALGHVLADQYQFLVRTGFTSVEVADGAALVNWRHALSEITVAYQPGAIDESPLSSLRRRVATPGSQPA